MRPQSVEEGKGEHRVGLSPALSRSYGDNAVEVGDESMRPNSVGVGTRIVNDFRGKRALLSTPEARALLGGTPKGASRSSRSTSKRTSASSSAVIGGTRPRSSPYIGNEGRKISLVPAKSAHLSVFDVNSLRRDAENLRIYKGIHGMVCIFASLPSFSSALYHTYELCCSFRHHLVRVILSTPLVQALIIQARKVQTVRASKNREDGKILKFENSVLSAKNSYPSPTLTLSPLVALCQEIFCVQTSQG